MNSVTADLTRSLGAENVRTDPEPRRRAISAWSPEGTGERTALIAAVALPKDTEEVAAVVRWANDARTPLYPVGGASNTVNASLPDTNRAEGIAVDLSRLDTMEWDEESLIVRAGAGLTLGAVEEKLNAHEYTLGHYPQSLNLLTVGGAVAVNAVGLLSGRYGRQSDLTLALTVVLPTGEIVRTAAPPLGSAAFDLHRLFIGTEGAFGIITEATLALHPLPEARAWIVWAFPHWDDAADALRLVYRSDARPACARLLDPTAAREFVERGGYPIGHSLVLLGFEGDELAQTGQFQLAYAVCQRVGGGGEACPSEVGEAWFDARRTTAGAWTANARAGGVADVLALSAPWSQFKAVYRTVHDALTASSAHVRVEAGHAGPHGAALEFAWEAQAATPDVARALYARLMNNALSAARAEGAAVAHHYGVGASLRRSFLAEERSEAGMAVLRSMKAALDPHNLLNPGKW